MKKSKKCLKTKTKTKTKTKKLQKYIGSGYKLNLEGEIEYIDDGRNIFTKMIKPGEESEKKIYEILKKNNKQIGIVKIIRINDDSIELELLNTDLGNYTNNQIKKKMKTVKTHLQKLGIMYIDWKPDNIGIDKDGELKLFDFDGSGTINLKTEEWDIHPPEWWAYRDATKAGMKTPEEIDDYAFNEGFKDITIENNKKREKRQCIIS